MTLKGQDRRAGQVEEGQSHRWSRHGRAIRLQPHAGKNNTWNPGKTGDVSRCHLPKTETQGKQRGGGNDQLKGAGERGTTCATENQCRQNLEM